MVLIPYLCGMNFIIFCYYFICVSEMKKRYIVIQYYEIESDLNKDELLELIKSGKIDLGKPEIKILEIS